MRSWSLSGLNVTKSTEAVGTAPIRIAFKNP